MRIFASKMKCFGIVIFFGLCWNVSGNIVINAKFMGNMRVSGDSYSVYAISVSQCLALCNKNKSCDAITFNEVLNKCRLFKKCVPMEVMEFDLNYWFYSRRPPVSDSGYFYEENSDTCLKVTTHQLPFKYADKLCAQDKGYLAVLYSDELRELAKKMLKSLGTGDAWINPPFKSHEKYAKNTVYRRKRKEDTSEKEDDVNNDCWLLKNYTVAKQSMCDEKRLSLCQLPTY